MKRDDIIYCTLHRNGSGQDSGEIDYSIRYALLRRLTATEGAELCSVAQRLLDELREWFS